MLSSILSGIPIYNINLLQALGVSLILTHITIAGVTLFLHRQGAHRSVIFSKYVNHFFRFWLWMTTGMVTKEWVAIHRKHHAKCETEQDPHSPIHKGIWKVLFGGVVYYVLESRNKETLEVYGTGTPDDWLERKIYSKMQKTGLMTSLAIDLILFGPYGLVIWIVQIAWIPFWAAGVINGIGHYFGYRTFSTKDASTNIFPLGILIGGEELHNNHHAFPKSAKLSYRRFEFDIGWMYIKILSYLGLARVVERSPNPESKSKPFKIVDHMSLLMNKMIVTRFFEKDVIRKIIEKINCYELPNVSKSKITEYLTTDSDLLKTEEKKNLSKLLQNDVINSLYKLRNDLQDVWYGASLSIEERFEKLKNWCKNAEMSNINGIDNFVAYLRSKMSSKI
jgi:stearoyl-CoA desaturase (delta-9 desaturase)